MLFDVVVVGRGRGRRGLQDGQMEEKNVRGSV
jgi:hypothetical protein